MTIIEIGLLLLLLTKACLNIPSSYDIEIKSSDQEVCLIKLKINNKGC